MSGHQCTHCYFQCDCTNGERYVPPTFRMEPMMVRDEHGNEVQETEECACLAASRRLGYSHSVYANCQHCDGTGHKNVYIRVTIPGHYETCRRCNNGWIFRIRRDCPVHGQQYRPAVHGQPGYYPRTGRWTPPDDDPFKGF